MSGRNNMAKRIRVKKERRFLKKINDIVKLQWKDKERSEEKGMGEWGNEEEKKRVGENLWKREREWIK